MCSRGGQVNVDQLVVSALCKIIESTKALFPVPPPAAPPTVSLVFVLSSYGVPGTAHPIQQHSTGAATAFDRSFNDAHYTQPEDQTQGHHRDEQSRATSADGLRVVFD